MTILTSRLKVGRAYVQTTALANTVEFTDESMLVYLTDGRMLSVPILWFTRLSSATPMQRANIEIGGGGISLH